MDVLTHHAYILKANRLSDSRWLLCLLTQEKGRLNVWYRKSRQGVAPNAFTPLWVEVKTGPSGHSVVRMEHRHCALHLTGEALLSAWYLNELLLYLVSEEEADSRPYHIYRTALDALRGVKDREALESILRHFEWHLLQALGYGIALTQDCDGVPLVNHHDYQCVPGLGLMKAESGVKGSLYLALSNGDWQSKAVYRVAKQLMRTLLNAALEGKSLKSRALFRSIYAP